MYGLNSNLYPSERRSESRGTSYSANTSWNKLKNISIDIRTETSSHDTLIQIVIVFNFHRTKKCAALHCVSWSTDGAVSLDWIGTSNYIHYLYSYLGSIYLLCVFASSHRIPTGYLHRTPFSRNAVPK